MLTDALFTLEEILDAADASQQVGGLVRQVNGLGLVALGQFLHHLDVLLGKQVVGRIRTLTHGLSNQFNGLCLGFGLADTGLCLTFGMQDTLLLGSFGTVDECRLLTFRCKNLGGFLSLRRQDLCALVSLGLHLLLHRG